MRSTVRWVTLVALLVAAAPAGAEPIVTMGTGEGPPAAVTDAAGTLQAVWRSDAAPGPDTLTTCRIPAGGTSCALGTIRFPGQVAAPVFEFVRPQDGALIVIASGHENAADITYASVSRDGGATFSAPAPVGRGLFEVTAAALTADGTAVETLAQVPSITYQRVPLAGATETRAVDLRAEPGGRDTDFGFPRIVTRPDGRPMIVASSPSTGTRYRVLRAGADPFANPSWTAWSAAPKIPGIGADPASGPNGVWALAQTSILDGQRQLLFRLRGSQFVRPRALGTIGGPPQSNDLGRRLVGSGRDFTEDAGGRLHAAWSRYEVCGPRRQCILYRRNEPRGFGPPVVYPLALTAGAPTDLQLAPNAGGSGWLVWRGGVGSGAPNLATPLVTPPRGSRVGSRRVARGPRVTLPTRYGCVAPGGVYHARLLLSGRRHGVRITAVRFSFDGGKAPAATDRHAPYRHTFRLPFAAGERHVAEARVTYRRGARSGHTQVGRAIVMCP
jgi:hypothetical protein